MAVLEQRLALRPITSGLALAPGFWGDRQRQDREATIPNGNTMLQESGSCSRADTLAVSYFSWANRGESDVRVWLPEHNKRSWRHQNIRATGHPRASAVRFAKNYEKVFHNISGDL